jgi:hypothetical protein
MEGTTPILSVVQLVSATVTGVFLTMPLLLMAVISFRPDRSPELKRHAQRHRVVAVHYAACALHDSELRDWYRDPQ